MAGEAYSKRYGTGFTDNDAGKPADAQFLNAVESALLRLLGGDPAADQVGVWTPGSDRFVFQKILNVHIDAAAAIAYSKLALAGSIVNADIAGAAAIAKSKLAALNIVNADIDAAAAIAIAKLAGYPADATKVLKGDGTWAAPSQVMEVISDTILGADTANFDLQSIPATYAHLRLVCSLRGTTAAGVVTTGILRFNNDSAANYDHDATHADTEINFNHLQANNRANVFSLLQIELPSYASTSIEKTAELRHVYTDPTEPANAAAVKAGLWRNTAAINRITIAPAAGNWKAGSRVTLYGIKAA